MKMTNTQAIKFFLASMFIGLLLLNACQETGLGKFKTLTLTEVVSTSTSLSKRLATPSLATSTTEGIFKATPIPVKDVLPGRIIFNYGFITNNLESRILYMDTLQEQLVQIPYFKYDMLPYGEGFSVRPGYLNIDEYKPSFENYSWSNRGDYIAFPCGKSEEGNVEFERKIVILVCVWDVHNLSYSKKITPKIVEEYNISTPVSSSNIFIGNISWSPDDDELFFTIHPSRYPTHGYGYPGPVEEVCFINRITKKVNCESINNFLAMYLNESGQSFSEIQAIVLSPFNKNYFAIRDVSGLYIIDVKERKIFTIWKIKNGFFQSDGKLLWYDNGKKIAFVINNTKNNSIIASADLHSQEVVYIFDYQEVLSKIDGFIPFGYLQKPTQIYISSFSPSEKYLLFEVDIGFDSHFTPLSAQNDQALGLFLYEFETENIYQVRDFVLNQYGDWRIHLNPDWGR